MLGAADIFYDLLSLLFNFTKEVTDGREVTKELFSWELTIVWELAISDTSSTTMPLCSRNFLLCISDSSPSPTSSNISYQGAVTWTWWGLKRLTGEVQRRRGWAIPGTRVRREQRTRERIMIRMRDLLLRLDFF